MNSRLKSTIFKFLLKFTSKPKVTWIPQVAILYIPPSKCRKRLNYLLNSFLFFVNIT